MGESATTIFTTKVSKTYTAQHDCLNSIVVETGAFLNITDGIILHGWIYWELQINVSLQGTTWFNLQFTDLQ